MLYLVTNPASKSGKGKNIYEALKTEMNHQHVVYESFFTDKKQGAYPCVDTILSQLNDTHDSNSVIGVLGGDGTLNEVLNALPDDQDICISYLPTGSSNDFARSLKITPDQSSFINNYRQKNIKKVDIGQLTNLSSKKESRRKFAVSCGIGLDAAVCKETNTSKVKNILNVLHLGKLSYVAIALKQIFTARQTECEITLADGSIHKFSRVLFIVTMIHPYEGGGIMMAPMADCHDGQFDIMVVSNIHRIQALYLLPLAFIGKHTKAKEITFLQSESVTIKTSDKLTAHTDGEYAGDLDYIHLECKKDGMSYL